MLLIFNSLFGGAQQSTLAGGRAPLPLIYVSRKLKVFPYRINRRKYLNSVALTLHADAGAYIMTGSAAALLRAALLPSDPGAFAITGSATLSKTSQTVTAASGTGLVGFGIYHPAKPVKRVKKKPPPRQASIQEQNEAFLLLAA